MAKLILQNQTEPASPDAGCTTLYVDSCDGKTKVKDSSGCINSIACSNDISYQNIYNSIVSTLTTNCSDGNMHITTSCGCSFDPNHNFFLCAKEYNFNTFCIDSGVILRFCGDGMPIIKTKCFVNNGIINTRGGVLSNCSCSFILNGSTVNISNIGSVGTICLTGGSGGNGNNGCGGGYDPEGTGAGGIAGDINGKGGPYAGGGGGSCYSGHFTAGGDGNQTTGVGGNGATDCYKGAGAGGGRGILCGGNGGTSTQGGGGSGGNGYYGKGGDGGSMTNESGSGGKGGDSMFGDGGTGGNGAAVLGGNGGNSYYGNGGNGGRTRIDGGGRGGNSYAGNGGNGGQNGCNTRSYGGSSLGGAYGLIIIGDNVINACIHAAGGNGGCGYCSRTDAWICDGCGTSGGNVAILYCVNVTPGQINVSKGTGANCTVDGSACILKY